MPRSLALGGVNYRKIFTKDGQLKRISGLHYWPLHKVLHEKYKFKLSDAKAFADFLMPMLHWDPEQRASAQQMLKHPWLSEESNYDTKMTEEDLQKKKQMDLEFQDEDLKVETSKLIESDIEQHKGGDEMSTLSDSFGLASESDDSFTVVKQNQKKKDKKKSTNFIARDIAEGRTFNNSFTGPYPEETDHLHCDKGPNLQF